MKHNKEVRNVTHERPLLAGHNVNVQHVVRHQPLIRFVDGLHGAIFELHQQEIVEHALIISVSVGFRMNTPKSSQNPSVMRDLCFLKYQIPNLH